MHTIEEFNQAISVWTENPDPSQRIPEQDFDPLRNQYLQYMADGNALAQQGILSAIKACETLQQVQSLLSHTQEFCQIIVPMHQNPGTFIEISPPFFEVAGSLRELSLLSIMDSLTQLMGLVPAANQTGDALSSAIMNVSHNLLYDDIGPVTAENKNQLIAVRLSFLINFLLALAEHNPELAAYYMWTLSGSDPHNGGKQVLMLEQGGTTQQVFKPRSMISDQSLLTPNIGASFVGLIPFYNALCSEYHQELPMPLPTLNIQCVAVDDFGMEQFAVKKEVLSAQEAYIYFTQMGALAFLAKLFGCTDLHQDNIMPTQGGPLIVDAECIFLLHILQSRNLAATGIFDAINNPYNCFAEFALSHFVLVGDLSPDKINVGFQAGFFVAQLLCKNPEAAQRLKQQFLLALSHAPTVRLVPFSTSELATALESYYLEPDHVVKVILDGLEESLVQYKITLFHGTPSPAETALHQAFRQGDIPSFQIRINQGGESAFFINGMQVGICLAYADGTVIASEFDENLQWLCNIPQSQIPILTPSLGNLKSKTSQSNNGEVRGRSFLPPKYIKK